MSRTNLAYLSVALLALGGASAAQAQTLEDRMRNQLRSTVEELKSLQAQQAGWQAEKAALEKERDALKAKLGTGGGGDDSKALKAELAAARAQVASLTAASQQTASAAQTSKAQADRAAAELQSIRTQAQTAIQQANAQLAESQGTIAACAAKNDKLYSIGREILAAYEHVGLGSVLVTREPFIGKKRVALENAVQAKGDELYDNKFDARVDRPAPTPAAPAAETPAASPPKSQ